MQEEKTHRKRNSHFDYLLIIAVFLISCFGLLILFSASSYYSLKEFGNERYLFYRQLIFLGAGFVVMLTCSIINYRVYYAIAKVLYFVSLGLSCATFAFGQIKRGSNRWIEVAGINIQPSELLKIGLILFLSVYAVTNIKAILAKDRKITLKFLAIGLGPALIISFNNLSTAIILSFLTFCIYFLVSREYRYFFIAIGVGMFVYLCAYPIAIVFEKLSILKSYQLERIFVWKRPEEYADKAYQTLQGLYAIGRGGLFGTGLGQSLQKVLLPEAQNDMIFAILCEETGLFGAGILILLYLFVIVRIFNTAVNSKDLFGVFLAYGIMMHFALQVILNISVVCNLLPNTGITLPFVSYGGSSTLIMSFEIGIILDISRTTHAKT